MAEVTNNRKTVERVADAYARFIARDNGWDDELGYDGWLEATCEWRLRMAEEMLAATRESS